MAGVNELAKLTGLKKQDVIDVFDGILNMVRNGDRVIIRGFGSFWEQERPARTVVSSALKGGKADVPPAKVLRFRSAGSTKRVVKARAKGRKAKGKAKAKATQATEE